MKQRVVLRGGPLDGHLREIDDRQHVAYVVHRMASTQASVRLGHASSPAPAKIILTYKKTADDPPKWIYAGSSDTP